MLRDTVEFKRGRAGERRVMDALMAEGEFIVPSYDFCGDNKNKAPRLFGLKSNFVIPDLDASLDGFRKWVEVKTKASAWPYYKTKVYVHGIDDRHYLHYLEVEKITGCPVFLFILEEDTQEILFSALRHLGVGQVHQGQSRTGWAMRNWPRENFTLYPSLEPALPTPPGKKPLK